eukprot:s571_g29.t2
MNLLDTKLKGAEQRQLLLLIPTQSEQRFSDSLVRGERIPPASSQSAGTKITERHLPCNVSFASAKRFHVRNCHSGIWI